MTAMRTDKAMFKAQAKKFVRSQKGNAVVEFALILPMFMALLLGVITFSTAVYNKSVLSISTREGARAGAIYVAGISTTDRINKARTAAENACSDKLISYGTFTPPTVTPTISGDVLTVMASFNFTGYDPFGLIQRVFPITARTTMMVEL
jgi:Flp pilus assembly protein TadG